MSAGALRRAALGVAVFVLSALTTAVTASAGTGWVIQHTPSPFDSSRGISDGFQAVSCTSPTACTAVGFRGGEGLAERWNGSAWAVQPTPPNSTRPGTPGFTGVSCVSTTCTAVGNTGGGTMVERWDGTRWSLQWTPTARKPLATLAGVSCTSNNACTAVGGVGGVGGAALAERWNGTDWTVQSVPTPSGKTDAFLRGVSCTSSTACVAAGYSENSTVQNSARSLIERWNGTTWTIQPIPQPAHTVETELSGVSCGSTSACTAVGSSTASSSPPGVTTLAEHWNGTAWTIQPTPTQSTFEGLAGVSCFSTVTCIAVGYTPSAKTLTEVWDGYSWTIQTTPNPVGYGFSQLFGASCTSATACTTVGKWNHNGPWTFTLAEQHS